MNFDEKDEEILKDAWKFLNRHTHFTYSILETILSDPFFVFIEKFDKNLFEKCFYTYFKTIDLFYSVLCWRFLQIREKIKKKVIDY